MNTTEYVEFLESIRTYRKLYILHECTDLLTGTKNELLTVYAHTDLNLGKDCIRTKDGKHIIVCRHDVRSVDFDDQFFIVAISNTLPGMTVESKLWVDTK